MGKLMDLVGEKFGKLTVVSQTAKRDPRGQIIWKCKCDCGNIKNILGVSLRDANTKSCGCLQTPDLTGVKFNRLTVISKCINVRKNSQVMWNCICECGTKIMLGTNKIKYKSQLSCGCAKYKGIGNLSQRYFGSLYHGAKSRKLKFDISIQYLYNLFLAQNQQCALSGLDINMARRYIKGSHLHTASVDRIDSKKGYVEGNVQWVHKDVNNMKNDLSMHDFLLYCDLVSNPIKTKYKRTFDYKNTHHNWKGCGELSGYYYRTIEARAKKKRFDISININDIWNLFVKQNGQCSLTGLYITLEPQYTERHKKQTASLDRIDSNIGYIPNNVQWVHKDINSMKMKFNESKFKYLCQLIVERN